MKEKLTGKLSNSRNRDVAISVSKESLSDSLELVDFAIGLVNAALNLPDGQVKFYG